MQEVAQLLIMLAAYYATFGIMAIGFATMFAGHEGAAAAADFFFLRPLHWAGHRAYSLSKSLLVTSATLLLHRFIDPLILTTEAALRWLLTRERGWLRRR